MSLIANGVFASSPRVTRGAPTVLKGDPKGKNFLYTNGLSVFIRDIENPALCDVYTQHAKEVRVACYAPSGFYIASGDISGKIRIWDTTQQEHLLKYEYQPISGEVRDIAWSPDSKRMVVVGNGGDKFGSVFLWDSGSSVGNITGHSKMINSVDYKPTRPFGICTASEDKAVGFYKGPPFKQECMNQGIHTNFVNVVRYAPDGSYFVSGGADGKCYMYDGKTGEMKHSVGGEAGAHKGSVYGLSWSADSKFLLSASADKTCKLWDVEANSVVTEFAMGQDLESQQLGCLWQGDHLLSVSLSGHINYLDKNNPSKPLRVIKGHSKNITALAISEDHTKVYSGSFDARICSWDVKTGQAEQFKGTGHSSQVTDLKVSGNCLVSCGMDDTVRFTTLDSEEYSSEFIKMDSQPRAVAVGKDGLVIVPCINEIVVIRDCKKVSSLNAVYEPCSAAVHPNQTEVAVGGGNDERIHIFNLENDTLVEKTTLKTRGTVYDLAYSPEGEFLASGDGNRRVFVFDTKDEWKVKEEWSSQTARVNTLSWTSDSKHIASSGLSTNITINHVGQTIRTWEKRACHPQSVITRLLWIDDNTLISAGHDCCLRLWKIEQ